MRGITGCLILFLLVLQGNDCRGGSPGKLTADDTTIVLWQFNEGEGATAKDSSPAGKNTGKIEGAKWVDGKFGKALEWGEDNGWVSAKLTSLPENRREITLEAWIYITNYPSGNPPFACGEVVCGGGCFLSITKEGALGGSVYFCKSVAAKSASCQGFSGNVKVPLNQWNHIALSVSFKEKKAALYLNGKVDGTTVLGYTQSGELGYYYVDKDEGCISARSYCGSDEKFTEKIDSVMISTEAKKFGKKWMDAGYPDFLWSEHKMLLRPGDDTGSGWKSLKVTFTVPGEKKPAFSKTVPHNKVEDDYWLDYSALADGNYILQITRIYPETEKVFFRKSFVKVSREGNRFQVKDGIPCLDGRPYFALGLCHVRPKDFKLVKEAGFNWVIAQFSDDSSVANFKHLRWQEGEDSQNGIKLAQELGLGCMVGRSIAAGSIHELAKKVAGTSAFLIYAVADEAPYEKRIALNLRYHDERKIIPQIPFFCGQNHPMCNNWIFPSMDIVEMDPYPTACGWPLRTVAIWTDLAYEAVRGKKPVWMALEAFGAIDTTSGAVKNLWPPSSQSLRAQAYMALARGSRGILYYAFDDTYYVGKDSRGCYLPTDLPDLWNWLKKLAGELNARHDLWVAPFGKATLEDPADILITSRHDYVLDNNHYLLLVNPEDKPVSGELLLEGFPQAKKLTDEFTGLELAISNGKIKVNLAPLQVMLLKVTKREGEKDAS